MKYRKERLFLELLPDYLIRELISFNIWNDIEKQIIEGVYIKKKTISGLTFDLNYEKTTLYEVYNSGILKLKKWLNNTDKTKYRKLYKVII
jgi:hypothetical protein